MKNEKEGIIKESKKVGEKNLFSLLWFSHKKFFVSWFTCLQERLTNTTEVWNKMRLAKK